MRDLSLHLLDVLENSARAGATCVEVLLRASPDALTLRVADNGPGFPEPVRADPTDPFRTTRTERKVGLGLSLLRQTAEEAGGSLEIDAPPGGGVCLTCRYDPRHIDAKPLGDLTGALMTALLAWPELRIVFRTHPAGDPLLDSAQLREALDGVALEHPRVQKNVRDYLDNQLQSLLESIVT